ncbi:hypothetical protein [Nocardioides alcanivorans]|uniref:hypothetical protein n=1 Tax=Nocardioides alcanivorans TaxID=2897352 RepID=UPI001F20C055|nr:hypothetical protein [Nocardioides alcanivorans]
MISQIHAEDFERFGTAWSPAPKVSAEQWHPAALDDIRFRRAAHQRILDLSQEAQRLREQLQPEAADPPRTKRRFGRGR